MAEDAGADAPPKGSRRRRTRWRLLVALLLVLVAGLAYVWLSRERLASEIIARELARRGIEARYEVVSIGPSRAVLRDIAIGDPDRPDLTVERALVRIRHRFGMPNVDEIRLVRPRLHGSYRDGELSFGALDPLIFTGGDQPFELPDVNLAIDDGRALLDSEFGLVGLSLTGSGWLRDGFEGELGAVAPRLEAGGCAGSGARLYGIVAITNAQPRFDGPLRLARLACADAGLAFADATLRLGLHGDRRMEEIEGTAGLALGAAGLGGIGLARTSGDLRFTFRKGDLTARYQLEGRALSTRQITAGRLSLDGSLRARREFDRVEVDAQLRGGDLRFGDTLDLALANAAAATDGTLLAPVLRQVRQQLAQQAPGSTIAADLIARRTGERLSLVVPEARLRSRSGETLLALSRFQLAIGGDGRADGGGAPRYSGNLVTGGGLPRIAARMEQRDGGIELTATMAPYHAGEAVLAVPRLNLFHASDGSLRFAGELRGSGPLPGGGAEGLVLPLSGSWSRQSGLAVWRDCAELRFDSLRYANLTLDRRRLTLCPPRGQPIVRYGARGLQVAAGVPSLRLTGRLGQTPIALASGPVGFAWPGTLTASRLNVALGPAATATRFAITDLTARIGREIGGTFSGTDVLLFAVPLDVREASGNWRYAGGRLTLADGAFRIEDRRQEAPRFNPLVARDATLALEDNLITAQALLREPTTGRTVTRLDLRHNLATGTGLADIAVEGLLFDRVLQPVALSPLALGIVANVEGVVTGSGRIDWSEEALSSSGSFSSSHLDFAAAFGPVAGASGTVRFTDLLGLTTAPGQVMRVRSVNPGIEVNDGEIRFQLRNGEVLAIEGGAWPFLGGTLMIRPLNINFGVEEVRAYVFDITGLEAARFVERIEFENLAATGTFDGTIPVVFDRQGNGSLIDGLLVSRPPGGTVSYVGELTYKDLSPMANFAFDALRSLDYRQMRIAMDGSLTGEIVTRVRIDGVRQGEGAESNFITRRLAQLPIRFDVNVRAPFFTLINSVRGLYDPKAIRDPRELGLLDAEGNLIRSETDGMPPPDAAEVIERLIQPSDREETP